MKDMHMQDEPVLIWTGAAMLEGRLAVPGRASALLLVASPGATGAHEAYRRIANHLWLHGFAVVFADLLTEDEQQFDSRTGHFRFDLPLFSARLRGTIEWIKHERTIAELPIVFFGAGVLAAAALVEAAHRPSPFAALILAEARTDLAQELLDLVDSPTLLVAADSDLAILRMNHDAIDRLRCEKRLEVLSESIRVIDDAMNVERVARLALSWAAAHAQPVAAW